MKIHFLDSIEMNHFYHRQFQKILFFIFFLKPKECKEITINNLILNGLFLVNYSPIL